MKNPPPFTGPFTGPFTSPFTGPFTGPFPRHVTNALSAWRCRTRCLQFSQSQGAVSSGVPWRSRWAACAVLTTLAVFAVTGHGNALASDRGDHERALQAVQSGQVLPLGKVLALVEKAYPGQVLEVELESHDRQWQYEIKLLQPDGRLMKLQVDARTGEVLKRQTRSERR